MYYPQIDIVLWSRKCQLTHTGIWVFQWQHLVFSSSTASLDLLPQTTPPSSLASSVLLCPRWLKSPAMSRHVHRVFPSLPPPFPNRGLETNQTAKRTSTSLHLICWMPSVFSPLCPCFNTNLHILSSSSSVHPLNLNSTFRVIVSINKPSSHHRCPVAGADWKIDGPNWKSMGPISSLSRADTRPTLWHVRGGR